MTLLLDNYDSFTYMIRDYILQCGEDCIVVRNDEMTVAEITALKFDSIVISPGPHSPSQAGITLPLIAHYAERKPILGICLGHQAIGEYYRATLVKAQRPMHGMTSTITHTGHFIFESLPNEIEVMRYHSLILTAIEKSPLEIIATTTTGEVMAVAHPTLPIVGLQFHPESILSPNGLVMLRNWYRHLAAHQNKGSAL